MTRIFETPVALLQRVGEPLGESEWITLDQARIDGFAEATGDHQWIHVDPVRAASGPFGACIAHGYLTLALVNLFLPQLLEVRGVAMGVNYGCDRVRFPNVVRVGSRVRGRAELVAAEEVKGGVQATVRVSVEIEGEERPGCVVDTISRYYAA
ncbi:MaoC family dehydratase [Pseudomonas solani]|uniref:MaoC family dehydratase n=1 Tax=Pseudomonas solani TaxID=2731552 RepID=UPI0035BE5C5A